MKSQLKKILALVACLCLVLPMSVYFATATDANFADFDTIVPKTANGDSSYSGSYTTTNGWVTENSAIQCGGSKDSNPQFTVIGPDNSSKAVCMNGKVSAPGKITSPTLTGGISKLTINYTKMFTDTKLGADITITDLATGAVYTNQLAKEADKNTKYEVWTYEWVLETPVAGDFTIVITNNSPTQQTGNKDRLTILDVSWESAAAGEPETPDTPDAPVFNENPYDQLGNWDLVTEYVGLERFGAHPEMAGKSVAMRAPSALSADSYFTYKNEGNVATAISVCAVVMDGWGFDLVVSGRAADGEWAALDYTTSAIVEIPGASNPAFKQAVATVTVPENIAEVKVALVNTGAAWTFAIDYVDITWEAVATPDEPDTPDTPDAPVAGTAYKFGMIQKNVSESDVYYLIGGMNGYYMATGTDVAAAIDVYLEETTGGYYMYTMVDGAKTYINMVVSGTHVNGAYEAAASTVYTYDATAKTVIANVNDAPYWFGTRNDKTYTTVGPCKTEYEGFYCQFYPVASEPETPDEPDTPVVPDEPETPTYELIDAPVAGTAYKFGMIQKNVSESDVYYLIGGMNGYYMATGTDVAAAIDVYLEETTGGYYMYTMVDGAKTYINMVVSGTHVNGAYEAAASTVYTYDATAKTVIANVNDAPYWFGTRNDKTYTTVGPCKTEYEGFYCQFYGVAGGSEPDTPVVPDEPDTPVVPDEPETPDVPAADSVLTIPEANKLGLSHEANTYTEGKYYVTGKVLAISNTTYGNLYIVDENNNQFYVYGLYDADGANRFDAMDPQPAVGDTITVYGIIGTYNGNEAQMKNGWMTDYVAGEGEPENTDPEADSELTITEAIALGTSKLHNIFTENKYYVTGKITEVYNDVYGNMYIVDDEGNQLTIYGSYDAEGVNRYDAMENAPVAGQYVKLYGIIGQYNGTAQMKNGWIIAVSDAPIGGETPDEPSEPSDPETPDTPDEPSEPETPDVPGESEPQGENTTGVVIALILLAVAAAVVVITAKKRA